MKRGWIAVDLDGTLAIEEDNQSKVGEPIGPMLMRVRQWVSYGMDVRIFTARLSGVDSREADKRRKMIQDWLVNHVGCSLPVTNIKDRGMIALWDDRAVSVERNTGK
jgi:hypothetical protein